MPEENKNKYEEVEKELKTRYSMLPPDLQQVITSSEYQMKLFEIAKKHKLTYEQLGAIEMETTMVLLGMVPPDDFAKGLADQINKKQADTKPIVDDITEAVFKPIHSSIIKLYDWSDEDVEEDEKVTPAAAPVSSATDMKKGDADILAKSGISIISDKPISNTGTAMPSRQSIITGVQNPPKFEVKKLNDIPKPGEKESLIATLRQKSAMPTPPPMQKEMPVMQTSAPATVAPASAPVTTAMPKMPEPPKPGMATDILPRPTGPSNGMMDMVAQKLSGGNISLGTTASYIPLSPQKMPEPPKAAPIAPPVPPMPGAGTTNSADAYREPIQ